MLRSPATRLLLGATLAALLLAASLPPASAGSSRALLQWWDDGWWGPGWGPGWGAWRPPSDPVGSGCYDPKTLQRISHGQSVYCPGGGKMTCDWGHWRGSCGSSWTRKLAGAPAAS